MLTGVAVGGIIPLVYSLLGDLFPITRRNAMAAMVQMAIGAGISGGQVRPGATCGRGARGLDSTSPDQKLRTRQRSPWPHE
jgi:MFS family permease